VVAAADSTLVSGARLLDGGICVLEAQLQVHGICVLEADLQVHVVEKGQPQIRLTVIDINHRLNPPLR